MNFVVEAPSPTSRPPRDGQVPRVVGPTLETPAPHERRRLREGACGSRLGRSPVVSTDQDEASSMPGGSRRDPSRKVVSSDSSQPEGGRGNADASAPAETVAAGGDRFGAACERKDLRWLARRRSGVARCRVGPAGSGREHLPTSSHRLRHGPSSSRCVRCYGTVRGEMDGWSAAIESPPETSRVCSSSPGGGPQIGHGKGEGLLGLPKQARGVASSTISTSGGASRRSSAAAG